MSLLQIVIIAESFIKHSPDLLNDLQILMSDHMWQFDYQLSIVTNNFLKVKLSWISLYLDLGSEYQREKSIYHWDIW